MRELANKISKLGIMNISVLAAAVISLVTFLVHERGKADCVT